jgi:hypothetical protein
MPGTFRPIANPSNDWLIDRKAQKDLVSYSGVEGFSIQDASLQESMGKLQDYSREHLVATDKPIAMTRRALYQAALALKDGVEPPALAAASQRVRAAGVLLDRGLNIQDWASEHLADNLAQPVHSV